MVDQMLECGNGHRHDGLRKWRFHPSMRDKDAAERLNIPVGTIRSWKSRGKIAGDESKDCRTQSWVWPWDILRMRYPDLVEAIELARISPVFLSITRYRSSARSSQILTNDASDRLRRSRRRRRSGPDSPP